MGTFEDDDNDDDHSGHGHAAFVFGSGAPEFLRKLVEDHEGEHQMRHQDYESRLFDFLESLTREQLYTLRMILHADANAHLDGMICAFLRLKHNASPLTGLTPEEALARSAGGSDGRTDSKQARTDDDTRRPDM